MSRDEFLMETFHPLPEYVPDVLPDVLPWTAPSSQCPACRNGGVCMCVLNVPVIT